MTCGLRDISMGVVSYALFSLCYKRRQVSLDVTGPLRLAVAVLDHWGHSCHGLLNLSCSCRY